MFIAGVDEAGRGPVIGPMVMAILAVQDESGLNGVKDSKELSPEERSKLFEKLSKMEHEIIMLEPEEIDLAVNDPRGDNLNKLEARTTALLIKRLALRIPLSKVIIDSPAKDGKKYEAVIREALDKMNEPILGKIELQCEIKADANYKVVGGASILAKVTRDEAVKALEAIHGPMGSGYPADPRTQVFLGKHWQEGHDFFRKSWASFKRLQKGVEQASLADFGPKAKHHKEEVEAFEVLKEHRYIFLEPSNQYEVVRMKNDKTSIIKYTTGKIVVQGPEKEDAEKLIKKYDLI